MLVISVSVIVYLVLFFLNKKMSFVFYELLCATTYLVSLSFIQTLDITMPIYIVFALLPYIMNFQVKSFFSISLLLYFSTVLLISMLLNGIAASLSIFLIRLSGLLLFYYVFSNIEFEPMQGFEIVASLVCEIVLTILGYSLSTRDDRLMLNFQCTVGCIATSFVLLCAYDFYRNKRVISLVVMLAHTMIACISGTRGYILVCLAVSFVCVILFLSLKQKLIAIPLLIAGIIIERNEILSVLFDKLRFGQSTGRRGAENQFVIKFMLERPVFNMLFGNGFGSKTSRFSITQSIVSEVTSSRYDYYILQKNASVHNFFLTILYSAGIIGLILVIMLYFSIIKTSVNRCADKTIKILIACFLVSYAILLWYRWSATSGILEFAVLAYILYDINRKSRDNTALSKDPL